MFRAAMCPSSGELSYQCDSWFMSLCVDDRLVCRSSDTAFNDAADSSESFPFKPRTSQTTITFLTTERWKEYEYALRLLDIFRMNQQQILQLLNHTHTRTHITNEDSPVHFDRQQFHRIHEALNDLRSMTEIFHDVNFC